QEPVTLASLGWQTSAGALYVPADDGLHHPWAPPGAIASLREVWRRQAWTDATSSSSPEPD
ncbi:MAG: hypothetical protein ACRDRX_27515, partial [Pseudonocardiaceae bacterium]